MDIRTILVPTDFSADAQHALNWALGIASQSRARVLVLHAIPPWDYSVLMRDASFSPADLEATLQMDAEEKAQAVVDGVETHDIPISTHISIGEPFATICQVAEQEQVDLIVMGSHGRTGLAHVLLGSIAERVVRHASCPVLVVRDRAKASSSVSPTSSSSQT